MCLGKFGFIWVCFGLLGMLGYVRVWWVILRFFGVCLGMLVYIGY